MRVGMVAALVAALSVGGQVAAVSGIEVGVDVAVSPLVESRLETVAQRTADAAPLHELWGTEPAGAGVDLLRLRQANADPLAAMGAGSVQEAARLARARQDEGSTGQGEPTPMASESEEPEEPLRGSWTFTMPVGDLDGDGADDLLVTDWLLETDEWLIELRSTVTGTLLWEADVTEGWLWPMDADLDGDGTEDFVELAATDEVTTQAENCDEWGWCDHLERSWTTEVRVRSGADGTVAWTHAFPSSTASHYEEDSDHAEWAGIVTSLDADGADLRLAVIDGMYEWSYTSESQVPVLVVTDTYSSAQRESLELRWLDGGSGQQVATQALEVDGFLWGSPTADGVLVEAYHRSDYTETCTRGLLGALTGDAGCETTGGDHSWSGALVDRAGARWTVTSEANYPYLYPLHGDVLGGTAEDVAHVDVTFGESIEDDDRTVTLIDGDSGATTSLGTRWDGITSIPDGTPGARDRLVSADYDYDSGDLALTRYAEDLVTPEAMIVHGPDHADDPDWAGSWTRLALDDGPDGCRVILATGEFTAPEGLAYPDTWKSESRGCDFSPAWMAAPLKGDHISFDVADLSGSTHADILTSPSYATGAATFEPTLLDGETGAVRWSTSIDTAWGYAHVVDRGAALLGHDVELAPNTWRTDLQMVDADGTVQWTRSSP